MNWTEEPYKKIRAARNAGEYARAGELYLCRAHELFGEAQGQDELRKPCPLRPPWGIRDTFQSALCYRLADADRLAEISAEHGVLAIESARERGFPFWDPNNETARRIAFAVADEWVAHLRTVTAEHPNGTAYDTATEQYQQLEETVSNQFGWTNEPEMFISPEMVASIADDTGYMGNSEFLGELDWWSFTNRITFLQEHTPALVKHVLDRGEWRKDD